jgi:hypothetical protein
MNETRLVVRAVLCVTLVLAFPFASAAQEAPRAEFSAGWRLLHAMDVLAEEDETFPAGWYADVSFNLTDIIALVGDVAGAYKTFDETVTEFGVRVDVEADVDVHTIMGGVRINARPTPRVTPFGQILFGMARGSFRIEGTTTVAGRQITLSESESETEFAIDAGGGVNINVTDSVGIRINGSYIRIGTDDGGNGFRFGAGVVVPF